MSDNPNNNQNVFGVEVDKLQKIGIVGRDGRVADNYPDDKHERYHIPGAEVYNDIHPWIANEADYARGGGDGGGGGGGGGGGWGGGNNGGTTSTQGIATRDGDSVSSFLVKWTIVSFCVVIVILAALIYYLYQDMRKKRCRKKVAPCDDVERNQDCKESVCTLLDNCTVNRNCLDELKWKHCSKDKDKLMITELGSLPTCQSLDSDMMTIVKGGCHTDEQPCLMQNNDGQEGCCCDRAEGRCKACSFENETGLNIRGCKRTSIVQECDKSKKKSGSRRRSKCKSSSEETDSDDCKSKKKRKKKKKKCVSDREYDSDESRKKRNKKKNNTRKKGGKRELKLLGKIKTCRRGGLSTSSEYDSVRSSATSDHDEETNRRETRSGYSKSGSAYSTGKVLESSNKKRYNSSLYSEKKKSQKESTSEKFADFINEQQEQNRRISTQMQDLATVMRRISTEKDEENYASVENSLKELLTDIKSNMKEHQQPIKIEVGHPYRSSYEASSYPLQVSTPGVSKGGTVPVRGLSSSLLNMDNRIVESYQERSRAGKRFYSDRVKLSGTDVQRPSSNAGSQARKMKHYKSDDHHSNEKFSTLASKYDDPDSNSDENYLKEQASRPEKLSKRYVQSNEEAKTSKRSSKKDKLPHVNSSTNKRLPEVQSTKSIIKKSPTNWKSPSRERYSSRPGRSISNNTSKQNSSRTLNSDPREEEYSLYEGSLKRDSSVWSGASLTSRITEEQLFLPARKRDGSGGERLLIVDAIHDQLERLRRNDSKR